MASRFVFKLEKTSDPYFPYSARVDLIDRTGESDFIGLRIGATVDEAVTRLHRFMQDLNQAFGAAVESWAKMSFDIQSLNTGEKGGTDEA